MENIELKNLKEVFETLQDGPNTLVRRGIYAGKHVAIKCLKFDDPEVRGWLRREVSIWSSVNNHPNVLRLVGCSRSVFETNSSYRDCCLVSEFMPFGSVESHIRKNTRFSVKDLLKIALGAALGLEYVHSRGLIHRDVKWTNFLLDKDLNVKLADFGFSEWIDEPMGGIVYTKRYAAPEVFQKKYGMHSDVYSFGVCLDMMCDALVKQNKEHNIRSAFPKVFKQLRDWCMEKEPGKRPNMSKVVEILKALDPEKTDQTMVIDNVPHKAYRQGLFNRLSRMIPVWA